MVRNNGKRRSNDSSHSNRSSSQPPPSSIGDKMNAKWANVKYPIVLACFKLKKRTNISRLEWKVLRLKSKFGVEYLTLVGDSAPIYDLQDCLGITLEEFHMLQEEIKENFELIKEKEAQINEKLRIANSPPAARENPGNAKKSKPKKPRGKKRRESTQKSVRSVGGLTVSSVKVDSVVFDYGGEGSETYESTSFTSEDLTPSRRPKRKLKKAPAGRRKR